MLDRRLALDPSLVLSLPLRQLDGASFMSRDAYGHLCTDHSSLWKLDGRLFDGVNDYVDCGNSDELQNSNMSVSAWIKVPDASTQVPVVSKGSGTAATGTGYHFIVYFNKLYVCWYDGNGDRILVPKGTINNNIWHHIAFTHDNITNTIYYYINGIEVGTIPATGYTPSSSSYNTDIGKFSYFALYFNGSVSDVRIWSRALSSLEVKRLYERGR